MNLKLTVDQLKELLPGSRVDGRKKNLYGKCPKCGEDEFGISLSENHVFGCFRKKECSFHGNIFTLAKFLGKDLRELAPGYEPKAKIDIETLLAKDNTELDLNLPDCPLPMGYKRIWEHDYLTGRGWEEEDYDLTEVGTTHIESKYKGFLIFPIRQFGAIKGTVARNTKTKEEIERLNDHYKRIGSDVKVKRYVNSQSDFAKMLLGIEEVTEKTDTIILVEGLFDKKNTDKVLGLGESEEVKCCATFKCSITAEQLWLLQQTRVERIIVLYDPDVIHEIKKAASELDLYFLTLVGFNEEGKDPGVMNYEDFDTAFGNLKSAEEFCRRRIDVPKLMRK